MGAQDPEDAYEAVLGGDRPGVVDHEPAVALVGAEDHAGTVSPDGPEVPELLGRGVGAELNLNVGILAGPHHDFGSGGQAGHAGSAAHLNAHRVRLHLAHLVLGAAHKLPLVLVTQTVDDEVAGVAADQDLPCGQLL